MAPLSPEASLDTRSLDLRAETPLAGEEGLHPAWEELLGRYEWSHFVSLTDRNGGTVNGLKRAFEQRFIRRLAFRARNRIPYFVVIETNNTLPHVHALLGGTAHVSNEDVRGCWDRGWTAASRYDCKRGAARYLTKDIVKGDAEFDFSSRLPRYVVILHRLDCCEERKRHCADRRARRNRRHITR